MPWLDRMISRVRSADNDEDARRVIDDYVDPATGAVKKEDDDGDTHIHLHMDKGGERMGGDQVPDPADPGSNGDVPDPKVAELEARVTALEQMLAELTDNEEEVELEEPNSKDARRFVMRRGKKMKARDQDVPVPERRPEMVGETDLPFIEDLDKRMAAKGGDKRAAFRDSADLEDVWQEAVASAEIIVPGFRMPTFDARLEVDRTRERLCSLRRRVMDAALANEETKAVIQEVVGFTDAARFKVLTCDSLKMAFNAVASNIKNQNNGAAVRREVKTGDRNEQRVKPPSIAEMNAANRTFKGWAGIGDRR